MKRISKSLRSISPFGRRQNGESEPHDQNSSKMNTDELQSPSDDENNSLSNNSLDNKYSLNGVSFKDFLHYFYSKFNPEKIGMIDYIAQEYSGDELIMISNLADKYQLSQKDMQRLIDVSKRPVLKNNHNLNNNRKLRAPPSETDSEPESEPNSEPISELSTSSLRNASPSLYSQQSRGRKGVSFSEANSVRTFDRHASPSRSTNFAQATPTSLQDIINRNRHDPATSKSTLANKSLLGSSLLSPSSQPGNRKPSPSMRSPSPTVGKGTGPKPQPNPAPARSSSPLQSVVRSQGVEENMDPAVQQRMLNQKNLRDKMLQNQQEEVMHQQRQNMLMHQQQDREEQQRKMLEQEEERQRLIRQQQQEEKQRQLQQVVLDDEQYLAQQVRMQSSENQQPLQQSGEEGGRTQTVHIEEIQQELARTREALTVADQEREEVLRLLEDMAAAPHSLRMQSVVEEYLAGNRSRASSVHSYSQDTKDRENGHQNVPHQSQYQLQLQHTKAHRNRNNNNASGSDSVASSTSNSNSLRGIRDLEGGQEHRQRTLSPNLRGPAGAGTKSKSYMLGTASSSKRETDNAVRGGKTGAFNIHASGNGRHPSPMFDRPSSAASSSASTGRSSSTGGQQFGQRFIRPSGRAAGSRGRSASPASSEYGSRRGRSSSPASSITSADVERQYNSAKQRIDSGTKQAQGNLLTGQRRIEQVAKESSLERQKALTKKPITDSPSRQRNVNSESVTDWVVCVDPKTQKKYYYSRSLSKSTWIAPPHLAGTAAASPVSNSGPPSRSGSASSRSRGSVSFRGRDRDRDSRGRSRDSSPAGSVSHPTRSASPAGSTASSSRGGGGSGGSAIWKSAKDPKSGRTYWFNRKTRESTWKNPFEVA